jgi:hypothetical protein
MKYLFVTFLLSLAACTTPNPPAYLNTEEWRSDDNGCTGLRAETMFSHPELLDELKGKSEDAILDWLGQPDKNELYRRSQKFYIYALDPSTECEIYDSTKTRYLHIRFSATNRAQEVMIYED